MTEQPGPPPKDRPRLGGLPRRLVAVGILMLARGRSAGLMHFDGSRQSVLAALAPLTAFMLVALALALLTAAPLDMLADLMSLAVGFLAQLVLSFEVARRWGRGSDWFRFATAFCWCQWAGPLVMPALLVIVAALMAAGVSNETSAVAGVSALFGYGLWLHWFLARIALRLSAARALALVVIVNALAFMLVSAPQLMISS